MPRVKKKKDNEVANLRKKMSENYRQTVLDLLAELRKEALVNALPFRNAPAFESNKWVANQGKYWQTVASAMLWAMDRISPENRKGRPKQCRAEKPEASLSSSGRMASTGLLTLSQKAQEPAGSKKVFKKRTRRQRQAS